MVALILGCLATYPSVLLEALDVYLGFRDE